MSGFDRRSLIKGGSALAAACSLSRPFEALAHGCPRGGRGAGRGRGRGHGPGHRPSPDYGPLVQAIDQSTGLPLLKLPEDFRYLSFGWRGDPMTNGLPTPAGHDGSGVIDLGSGKVLYVRNHELIGDRPFAGPEVSYDAGGGGGTTSVRFDQHTGQCLDTTATLSGTIRNCAGGLTPWASWLSCEENLAEPGGGRSRTHGWVFEVPAIGLADPTPLTGLGRFNHEAVAVDPATGIVYETEDQGTSGLYRFLPDVPGELQAGGTLQMLKVAGVSNYDTSVGQTVGKPLDVEWVPIADPGLRGSDGLGVYRQGAALGGARILRGEGMWHGNGRVYFVSTIGGNAGAGQVWELDPAHDTLRLLYESPGNGVLDAPDNVTVSPRGGLLLCEDGGTANGQYLRGLTGDGEVFDFALNDMVLAGQVNGLSGDFRSSEWAGACFTPDGQWLLVNLQTPGVSFAITGPWRSGAL
jgi:secreted PhoX family phosphatase